MIAKSSYVSCRIAFMFLLIGLTSASATAQQAPGRFIPPSNARPVSQARTAPHNPLRPVKQRVVAQPSQGYVQQASATQDLVIESANESFEIPFEAEGSAPPTFAPTPAVDNRGPRPNVAPPQNQIGQPTQGYQGQPRIRAPEQGLLQKVRGNNAVEPVNDPFGDLRARQSVLNQRRSRMVRHRYSQDDDEEDDDTEGGRKWAEFYNCSNLTPPLLSTISLRTDPNYGTRQLGESSTLDIQAVPECPLIATGNPCRSWGHQTMTWTASALCHKPLYFENIQLERYGHSYGPVLQPFRSTAHFFTNIAFLPFNMGVHSPNECRYALGFYRPGDCAPWLKQPIPFTPRAIAFQALTVTSLPFLIP